MLTHATSVEQKIYIWDLRLTSVGAASDVGDVVDGLQQLVLVIVGVQVELGVGSGGELLDAHADVVLADVPVLTHTTTTKTLL